MESKRLLLPAYVEDVCRKLENAGYSAYCVGGAVRDLLLGRKPEDFDVATAAPPQTVQAIFSNTVPTGLMHGTVMVLTEGSKVEVTTFRQDGAYTDKRRPDMVTFVDAIAKDLTRRDFTVNAIAYSPKRGICDPFFGIADLKKRQLCAVGDARTRFEEDALRILRLYRFSAQLSFSIEAETEVAAKEKAENLRSISIERAFLEITKLLSYGKAEHLMAALPALCVVLPEAEADVDTLRAVAACKSMPGKWARLCGRKTYAALERLHSPKKLKLAAAELAAYKKGNAISFDIASLRYATPADLFAFSEGAENAWEIEKTAGAPQSLGELAIDGRDVEAAGFRGEEIGKRLQALFMYAIQNPADNNKEILREVLEKWKYEQNN